MPANLRTCADCSTAYAIDLSVCPHCGSANFVDEGGAVSKRLPLFVAVSCPGCGRGPWTVRLPSITSGLIDLPSLACASCGSRVPVSWPPEEEPMPKNHVGRMPTDVGAADVSPAADADQSPQVVAEDGLGRPVSAQDGVLPEGFVPEALPEVSAEAYAEDAVALAEPGVDPYAGMTLAELRGEADKRGVPSYGSKAQITERLREDDAAAESAPSGD